MLIVLIVLIVHAFHARLCCAGLACWLRIGTSNNLEALFGNNTLGPVALQQDAGPAARHNPTCAYNHVPAVVLLLFTGAGAAVEWKCLAAKNRSLFIDSIINFFVSHFM